ncbi:MAG: metallophosphoesterase family protein [Candidatus Aminicenantes bacterium]|jgi:predicted phosphodiesterase
MPSNKIAVISDVHANYQALQAVLSHAEKQGVEEVWFLGDAVGYGPEPYRCLKLLKEVINNPRTWVLGNHDQVMRFSPEENEFLFKQGCDQLQRQVHPITQYIGDDPDKLAAFRINYHILDTFPGTREFLLSHPSTSQIETHFFLFHGGVRNGTPSFTYTKDRVNVQEEYFPSIYKITGKILEKLKSQGIPDKFLEKIRTMQNQEISGEEKFVDLLQTAMENQQMEEFRSIILKHAFLKHKKRYTDPGLNIFLFGHTHLPACFKGANQSPAKKIEFVEQEMKRETRIQLDDDHVWFINPGSVGQPRDGDPRASYIVLDRNHYSLQLHRVEYKIAATQRQMKVYKMPHNFILRLSQGR